MKRRIFQGLTTLCLLVLLAGCLTINVYFPAAAVQAAADQFVSDVQSGAQPPAAAQTPTPNKESSLSFDLIGVAHAEPSININTPESQRLKAAMQGRAGDLNAFKDKGALGESKKGLVEERDVQGLGLPERAKLKKLVSAENSDREDLYKEVIKANKYPSEKKDDVRTIFAKSWQGAAKPGWWIQNEDGAWVKK